MLIKIRKLRFAFWLWYTGFSWLESYKMASDIINWEVGQETIDRWLK
jgi:hypothetical protein